MTTVLKLKSKKLNVLMALVVFISSAILLITTSKDIGMVWDEPAYMKASQSYSNWVYIFVKDPIRALEAQNVDTYFETNHEHPPVAKIWSGIFWYLTNKFVDPLTAFRIGPILGAALLFALLYFFIAEQFGLAAGLFASASLIFMPRFFFHAHLDALDVPVAALSFITTLAFWKTVDRKWGWSILCGLLWGLAVGVKLNGVFVFFALLLWVLIFRRSWKAILKLVVMGSTAVLTFFLSWPWLFHDTVNRLVEYVMFHVGHYRIGQWYLGQFYVPPPWHAVFVILWAVIPVVTLILFGIGIGQARKGRQDGAFIWLLIISAVISILPFAIGKALLYDNERLMMPVYPYIAALAGIGFVWVARKVQGLITSKRKIFSNGFITAGLGILLLAPQIWALAKYYPNLLSYYSGSVGGIKGATSLGLETTYWCENYGGVLDYLNENAEPNELIWAECDTLRVYKEFGMLREDLKCQDSFTTDADWYLLQFRQSQYGSGGAENYPAMQFLKDQTPSYQIQIDGVPLLNVYYAHKFGK